MRNACWLAGAGLSCLLLVAVPRTPNRRMTGRDLTTVTQPVTAAAQQLAQDESQNSNTGSPEYGEGDNSNNPYQPNAQSGGDNGDDSSQANSPSDDNGGDSGQMNAGPGDTDNSNQNQNSDDSQNSENSNDSP